MDEKTPLDVADATNGRIELHQDRVRIRWKDSFGNLRSSGRTHTDVLLDDVESIDVVDVTETTSGRFAVRLRSTSRTEPEGAPEPAVRFKPHNVADVGRLRRRIEERLGAPPKGGS
jgi:hypothetical protein